MAVSRIFHGIAATAVMSIAASSSSAQQAHEPVTTQINNWSYLRHSSTVGEGYLRGSAAVIQSVGQANYFHSIAAMNYQEAVRRRIENSRLYVQTYYDNKETNRLYREKYQKAPPTKEQWARITAAALPKRLTDEQYNAQTGDLIWPHIMRTDEYKPYRERIDALFAARTPENSGDGSPFQIEVAEHIDTLLALLKANLSNVTRSQYGAAKEFLLSVDYEAFLPQLPSDSSAAPEAPADSNTPVAAN